MLFNSRQLKHTWLRENLKIATLVKMGLMPSSLTFRLNFSNTNPAEIELGMTRLAEVLKEQLVLNHR